MKRSIWVLAFLYATNVFSGIKDELTTFEQGILLSNPHPSKEVETTTPYELALDLARHEKFKEVKKEYNPSKGVKTDEQLAKEAYIGDLDDVEANIVALEKKYTGLPLREIIKTFKDQGSMFSEIPASADENNIGYIDEEGHFWKYDVTGTKDEIKAVFSRPSENGPVGSVVWIQFHVDDKGQAWQWVHRHTELDSYYGYAQDFFGGQGGVGSTLSHGLDEAYAESLRQKGEITIHGFLDRVFTDKEGKIQRIIRFFYVEAHKKEDFVDKKEADVLPPQKLSFEPFTIKLSEEKDGVRTTKRFLIPRPRSAFRGSEKTIKQFDATEAFWAKVSSGHDVHGKQAFVDLGDKYTEADAKEDQKRIEKAITEKKTPDLLIWGRFGNFVDEKVFDPMLEKLDELGAKL